jgi:hypothetical protein
MAASVYKSFQRFNAFPYGQVYNNPFIVKRSYARGIIAFLLQAPDEPCTAFGQRIDVVKQLYKINHKGVVHAASGDAAYVYLCQLAGKGKNLLSHMR